MKRRDFLASGLSALAGAAAWRPNLLAAARIRFGYAAITWNGNDRQAIDDIAALGFHGVQLRQSAFDTWGDRPAELKELLAQKNLVLVALSSGNISLDNACDDDMLNQHVRHAHFVRAVGGQYLQVIDERPRGRDPLPEDYRRMGRLLTELGRRSADLGIPLGYHHHMGALGQSPDEVARVLDAADPRFVRLLLDTAHYQQAGGDPAAAVRRHAGRLLYLHLKDLAGERFVEMGRGRVDFKAVFASLDAIGFDGWGVVELDSVPDPGGGGTPKGSGAISRRYLETLKRWNDAS
jgi:inosose dehydratase